MTLIESVYNPTCFHHPHHQNDFILHLKHASCHWWGVSVAYTRHYMSKLNKHANIPNMGCLTCKEYRCAYYDGLRNLDTHHTKYKAERNTCCICCKGAEYLST